MANMADLQAEIATLKQSVIDDETADDQNEADLNKQIVDLKALVAAGTPIDTTALIASLEDIKSNLHAPVAPAS